MDFDSLVDDSQNQQPPQATPTPAPSSTPTPQLKFDDLKDDSKTPLKFDDLKEDGDKYSTPGQQALTAGEHFVKGFAPGIGTYAENKLSEMGVPNLSPQDQLGRQTANPTEAMVPEIAGNIALTMALPEVQFAKLGVIGSKAINTMLQMGAIGAGDEFSKTMLGQGDPLDAAAWNVAKQGAAGLFGGAIFGKAESAIPKALENAKLGAGFKSFLSGMGHAATFPSDVVSSLEKSGYLPEEIKGLSESWFQSGQHFYNRLPTMISSALGAHFGGIMGGAAAAIAEKAIEKSIAPVTNKISQKIASPILLKAAANGGLDSLANVLDHAAVCQQGKKMISNGVESLFKAGGSKTMDFINDTRAEAKREKVKEFIENGGVDSQIQKANAETPQTPAFAKGGEVKPLENIQNHDAVATVWPEQNTLINSAKARVSSYLNSVRPVKKNPGLPFDAQHDDPQKEHEYNKIIDLANNPLKVLGHIKDGTLSPKHVKAINEMYPELYSHLSKKITERLMQGQTKKEKKPAYHVRQSMSLFLGSNLDSTLSQANIMAAQNVFIQQKAMAAPQKADPALNKMGKSAMSPGQHREERLNKD